MQKLMNVLSSAFNKSSKKVLYAFKESSSEKKNKVALSQFEEGFKTDAEMQRLSQYPLPHLGPK
jgi:hypothetical protein